MGENAFGVCCGFFGCAIEAIGLPSDTPSETRKLQKLFHTDQARRTDAGCRSAANAANADRNPRTVTSPSVNASSGTTQVAARCARTACRSSR